jgi:hypothetical protein
VFARIFLFIVPATTIFRGTHWNGCSKSGEFKNIFSGSAKPKHKIKAVADFFRASFPITKIFPGIYPSVPAKILGSKSLFSTKFQARFLAGSHAV